MIELFELQWSQISTTLPKIEFINKLNSKIICNWISSLITTTKQLSDPFGFYSPVISITPSITKLKLKLNFIGSIQNELINKQTTSIEHKCNLVIYFLFWRYKTSPSCQWIQEQLNRMLFIAMFFKGKDQNFEIM